MSAFALTVQRAALRSEPSRRPGTACDDVEVNSAAPAPLLLVQGDEELLAARAITAAVDAARAAEPGADVREYEAGAVAAGEVAEMLSPSLFGGRRVLVIRSGQDARKDLVAALLAYAKNPDPDVTLIVSHPGGAKGKVFADGLRAAGAEVVAVAKLKGDRERIAFVRDEFRRNGGRCDEASASALHVGVDPVPIADAIADGVRTVARVAAAGRGNPYSLASSLGMPAWKIQRAQERSRGWTPEGLVDAMRAAADCNAAVKGGAEDRGYALEQAVFAVAAARHSGGAR
jgi:DNA polymerase-3 subunit delta